MANPTSNAVRFEKFKENLRSVYSKLLRANISRELAWEIYKRTLETTIHSVITDGRLVLPSIGSYEIIKATARKSKMVTHKFAPKFRFRPGERIEAYLEQVIPGVFYPPEGHEERLKKWEKKKAALDAKAAERKKKESE